MKYITTLTMFLLSFALAACQDPIDRRPDKKMTNSYCQKLAKQNGYDNGKLRDGACVFTKYTAK